MARVPSFVLLVVLFFLVASKQGYGFPTKLPANDFEDDKGEVKRDHPSDIRQILLQAAKELKDQDVIKTLKKSLILRMKICFSSSPLPTGGPEIGVLPYEDKRDEELTPEQKHGLRTLLKEALEYIDEEEILNFLKASLYFRLRFCLHTPFLSGPYPEPGPSPGTGTQALSKPTPIQGPRTTFKPTTNTSEGQIPISSRPTTNQSAVSPTEAMNENPTKENTINTENTENNALDLPEEYENVIESISRRDDIPAAPVDNLPRDELTGGDDTLVPINGQDPALQLAELEGLEKQLALPDLDQTDDNNVAKLLESVVDDKETTVIDESDDEDDVSIGDTSDAIGDTSDAVGKATIQEEKQSVEMMTEDSDEGEFNSVIRIDYDLQDDEEEKTGAGGGDLGPVIEPPEELSLY